MMLRNILRSMTGFRNDLLRGYPYREYFRDHECIFVHIPKTAGTSILELICSGGKYYRDHATWEVYYKTSPQLFDKYFKFSFVRNPYDRLVSLYEYMRNGGNGCEDLEDSEFININYPEFDSYVIEYLDKDIIYSDPMLRPQYTYICGKNSDIKVDFVGRFEVLDKDVVVVARKLGVYGSIKHLNPAERGSYKNYYSNSEVKIKVADLYSRDFDIFGYKR